MVWRLPGRSQTLKKFRGYPPYILRWPVHWDAGDEEEAERDGAAAHSHRQRVRGTHPPAREVPWRKTWGVPLPHVKKG